MDPRMVPVHDQSAYGYCVTRWIGNGRDWSAEREEELAQGLLGLHRQYLNEGPWRFDLPEGGRVEDVSGIAPVLVVLLITETEAQRGYLSQVATDKVAILLERQWEPGGPMIEHVTDQGLVNALIGLGMDSRAEQAPGENRTKRVIGLTGHQWPVPIGLENDAI